MRVGRAALDEEAIRLIEEYNRDVEFDWTRILKGQEVEPTAIRDHPQRAARAARRRPAQRPPPSGSDLDFSSPEDRDLTPERPGSGSDLDFAGSEDRDLTLGDPGSTATEFEEAMAPAEEAASAEVQRPTQSRLGSEGLARLRARYAEVMARISERVQDPGRQEELKAQAERLNPDTWVTDAEVSAGLEGYETTFEALRTAIGGPSRRRRRKKRRGGRQGGPLTEGASDETGPDVPADGGGGEDDRSDDI